MKKINITENRLKQIVTESINKVLNEKNTINEVNNNLTFRDFDKTMTKILGFERINKKAPGIAYIMPGYHGEVSMHIPHDGSAKADMIRNTIIFLKSINWFDDPINFRKFPFNKWGVNPKSVKK